MGICVITGIAAHILKLSTTR